jgi:hypothetical protein
MAKNPTKKQLWDVPPSQGKGRIGATTGGIVLLIGMAPVVHFIYDNQDLLERDQEEFKDYWRTIGKEDCVKHHVGFDFPSDQKDLFIIDESDVH